MAPQIRKFAAVMLMIILAGLGISYWYQNLDDDRKRFFKNMASQAKYLPARYMV
jgi:hypothetical protein